MPLLLVLDDAVSELRTVAALARRAGFSGCEILRFRNAHPSLKGIPALIWTLLRPHEREICKRFGAVGFVSKDDDPNVLIGELDAIIANVR